MNWKEEIKQKQDLVDIILLEIEEIKRSNAKTSLKPLKEQYLNKFVKIKYETCIYIT